MVRSDDWVGTGARREGVSDAIHRDTFVELAFRWLEQGRCTSAVMTVPATVRNYDGDPLDARATAVWVVNILLALEPYVPRLRAYQAAIASGPAATVRARIGWLLKAHVPAQIIDQQATMSTLATVTA